MGCQLYERSGNFNPLPPWGGRPCNRPDIIKDALRFQSTPSVGRETALNHSNARTNERFQSTPSVGRETSLLSSPRKLKGISIHSLRGEGDLPETLGNALAFNFNPLPPWGGRRTYYAHERRGRKIFQSTPSVGRETLYPVRFGSEPKKFQSTPSVGRETPRPDDRKKHRKNDFNPLPPWGGRLRDSKMKLYKLKISIHSLRGEGDSIQRD